MQFHSQHPLQPFWNLAAAPVQSQALILALEHDVFELLQVPANASAVATQRRLGIEATSAWLELLWSMGLLVRDQSDVPEYRTAELADRFFCQGAAENCAQAWLYRAQTLGSFAQQMGDLLQNGSSSEQPSGSWAQAAQVQIHQEQQAVSVPAVLRLLDGWPVFSERGRFLDLGGGPGHVAIALAQRLASWHGTLCELPATAEVAAVHIERAGVAQRLSVQGCDLEHDELPGGYDLIWCSSVLHFLRDPQAVLNKIFKALNPGGRLIIAHAEVSPDADLAALVMPFYAPMMMRGRFVPHAGEISQLMTRAGFTEQRALGRAVFPMSPVWVHTGVRP